MKKTILLSIAFILFSCNKNENSETVKNEVSDTISASPKIVIDEVIIDSANYVPYHKRSDVSTERASYGDANSKENDLKYIETEINKENPGNESSLYNRSGQLDKQDQAK